MGSTYPTALAALDICEFYSASFAMGEPVPSAISLLALYALVVSSFMRAGAWKVCLKYWSLASARDGNLLLIRFYLLS